MKSLLTIAFFTSAALGAPAHASEQKPQQQRQPDHANHIFNSIHSSMRQWGSSLYHNGMSVFLAEVPEDIEFYHGTSSPYRVNGTEWLAFEPEHALMFARGGSRGPPGGGKGGKPPGRPEQDEHNAPPAPSEPIEGEEAKKSQEEERKVDLRRHEKPDDHKTTIGQLVKEAFKGAVEQKPVLSGDAEERHGYLHTYRTKHPLRLLYVDGQSAAKSEKGTLDVQDMVLLHQNPPTGAESRRLEKGPKGAVDEEDSNVEILHKRHDEPSTSVKRRRHYAIEGNNRNREWIAHFFEGDDDGLELLPPPPEFRDRHQNHRGPPPPWFHPNDEERHESPHPPPSPPPEFARHHQGEHDFPPPSQERHHGHDEEKEEEEQEHEHRGDLFDLFRPHHGGQREYRGPKFDDEEEHRHHGGILSWFRPHHEKDQHDSKYDGEPLFERPPRKSGKGPHPQHDFDESKGKKDYRQPFDKPHSPDDHFEGQPPKHGRPDDHFNGPPSEHGEPHGPHDGPPARHQKPHDCPNNNAANSMPSGQENEPRHHGPMSEGIRADRLCRMAREEFRGKIDGFLRMEGGFEIILCDFEKHLDIVQIGRAKEDKNGGHPGGPHGGDSAEGFNSLRAVAARYDGIGGERVKVDYDNFVSLYAYEDAVYFDDAGNPRVNNETEVLKPVISAIEDLALKKPVKGPKKNWQAIADMTVTRYADRIEYLASGQVDTLEAFKAEADRALRPFIDYSDRNATREVARCAAQFPPTATSDKLAGRAIHTVSSIICRTFSRIEEVDELSHGLSMIRGLKSWLAWTEWKKCRGCAVNEVCVIPIWPMGDKSDFEHPQCKSGMSGGPGGGGSDRYWDGPGGPGGPRSRA